MDTLGIKEGEVITHSMITKSIERAQKKIEAMNFASRKNIIEYDDVIIIKKLFTIDEIFHYMLRIYR